MSSSSSSSRGPTDREGFEGGNDNDDNGDDLSDEEWRLVREKFEAFLPRFGDLWRTLAADNENNNDTDNTKSSNNNQSVDVEAEAEGVHGGGNGDSCDGFEGDAESWEEEEDESGGVSYDDYNDNDDGQLSPQQFSEGDHSAGVRASAEQGSDDDYYNNNVDDDRAAAVSPSGEINEGENDRENANTNTGTGTFDSHAPLLFDKESSPAVAASPSHYPSDEHESEREEAKEEEEEDDARANDVDDDGGGDRSSSSEEEEAEFDWTGSQQGVVASQQDPPRLPLLEEAFAAIRIDATGCEEKKEEDDDFADAGAGAAENNSEDASEEKKDGGGDDDGEEEEEEEGDTSDDDDEHSSDGSTVVNFNHINFETTPVAADEDDDNKESNYPPSSFTFDQQQASPPPVVSTTTTSTTTTTIEVETGQESNNDWDELLSPLSQHSFHRKEEDDDSAGAFGGSGLDDAAGDPRPTETKPLQNDADAHNEDDFSAQLSCSSSSPCSCSSQLQQQQQQQQQQPEVRVATAQPSEPESLAIDLTMLEDSSTEEEDNISPLAHPPRRRKQRQQQPRANANSHCFDLTLTSSGDDEERPSVRRGGFRSSCQSPRMASSSSSSRSEEDEKEGEDLSSSSSEEEYSWKDGDSSVDVDNDLVDRASRIAIVDSDDDGDEGESEEDRAVPPKRPAIAERNQQNQKAKAAFRCNREALGQQTFTDFDKTAFGGRLSSVTLKWSNLLRTTAGLTRLKSVRQPGRSEPVRVAEIELSSKVITDSDSCRATLLHEMCHAAAWIVDGNSKPPHGPVFQRWADRAMARIPDVEVTTTHNYEIEYKFAWACQTPGCGVIIQRQSRSVHVDKHVCANCKGKLVEVHVPKKGGGGGGSSNPEPLKPRKKAAPNKYNLFVQENSASVRRRLESENRGANQAGPAVAQQEVMKECARLWRAKKDAANETM